LLAFRIAASSIWTAFRHPRVLLAAWAVVTVPALFVVLPLHADLERAAAGASVAADASFPPDAAAEAAALQAIDGPPSLIGPSLFVLLAWAFLGGGILSTVGLRRRFVFDELLSEGGAHLLRSLRVLVLGLVPALVVAAVGRELLGRFEGALLDRPQTSIAPGWPLVEGVTPTHLLDVARFVVGFAFVFVVFTAKVALARIVLDGRRSALLAWFAAVVLVVRHPLRTTVIVGLLTGAWLAGVHLFGALTVQQLEVGGDVATGLLFGQLGVLWAQSILVAFTIAARRFVGSTRPEPEPVVVATRAVPRRAAAIPFAASSR
jgi:hypothetical protein